MANNYDQSSDVDSAMEQDVSLTTAATTAQYDQEVLSDGEEHARQQPDVKTQTEQVNEADLRKLIMAIQRDTTIDRQEKARRMQYLMSHGTLPTPPDTSAGSSDSREDRPNVDDATPSYHDKANNILGCKHYRRKVKLVANCCGVIFPCRFCHDEASDHNIIRHETKEMVCMQCQERQPASQHCRSCGIQVAKYYCDKCKLWDDDENKSIYHCDDCGICRQGKGLGQDFFHCRKCNICMSMSMRDGHRCIERNLESDCPICGEYMFTSTTTVIFMPCGHCIHKLCYTAYIQTSYQCPTCLKSLGDMSEYFERLDRELERQPMPPEYEKYVSYIFCNDCEKKSRAKYHFFYHKCEHCKSYNTTVLKTENREEQEDGKEPFPEGHPTTTTTTTGSSSAAASSDSRNNDHDFMQSHGSGATGNGSSSSSSDRPPSTSNNS
ncbi:hypothetical protein LRAMOSA05035 [Lichtheimia ramosa]|uniref:Zf-CHY-domain-containing protein n=1 Tax=Lichtheimia ramosa TaxID=688394 RepID=A0A077WZ09_9FUNG|nr:hypothetical protein LRAMOSA05035 [Lichtheimia ramosa]